MHSQDERYINSIRFRKRFNVRYLIAVILLLMNVPAQALVVGSNTALSRQSVVMWPAADGDNEVRGFAAMDGGIILENSSTSLLFNAFCPLRGSVRLNGGTLNLNTDVLVEGGADIQNVGTINGNSHSLRFTTTTGVVLPSEHGGPKVLRYLTQYSAAASVRCADWSYDNNYVCINDGASTMRILQFNGTNFVQKTSLSCGSTINSIRWHPSGYYVAVAMSNQPAVKSLKLYSYNSGTNVLTLSSEQDNNSDVTAGAWTPIGDYFAVAVNTSLELYSFSAGSLSLQGRVSTAISSDSMSWDSSGTYLSVGRPVNTGTEFLVYKRTGNAIAANASVEISQNVNTTAWSPTKSWIAIGFNAGSDTLRIYEHSDGVLTEKTAARIGETLTVSSVAWKADGTQIVIGCVVGNNTEFRVYDVDQTTAALTLVSGLDSFNTINVVRWSPAGYILLGDANSKVILYDISQDSGIALNLLHEYNTAAAVQTADWSYDNNYLCSNDAATNARVFSFNRAVIESKASTSFSYAVRTVRWHPSQYYVAIGIDSDPGDDLFVFTYNSVTNTFTLVTGAYAGGTAAALAWHPSGNHIAMAGNNLRLFSFSGSALSQLSTLALDVCSSYNALCWDSSGTYIALGMPISTGAEFRVYKNVSNSFVVNASVEFGQAVTAVDWSPTKSWIAVGLSGGTERLRIYEHSDGSLTEKTGARVGESTSVLSLHWNSDGTQLVVGLATGSGTELRVYNVDQTTAALTLVKSLPLASNINVTRWSPNDGYIARGTAGNKLGVCSSGSTCGDSFVLNNLKVGFTADLILKKSIQFDGTCMLDMTNHVLDLQKTSSFVVGNGASLLIKDAILKGLHGDKIKCLDSAGTISLCNVALIQDGDFTFTQGKLDIIDDTVISGTNVFIYQSAQQMTIGSQAELLFDAGMSFSYAAPTNNRLVMTNATSKLHLYDAMLYSMVPEFKLTKGMVIVDGDCSIITTGTVQFGDGITAANNCELKILAESNFEIQSGYVLNKNV